MPAFCPDCGKKLPDIAVNFCPECGFNLNAVQKDETPIDPPAPPELEKPDASEVTHIVPQDELDISDQDQGDQTSETESTIEEPAMSDQDQGDSASETESADAESPTLLSDSDVSSEPQVELPPPIQYVTDQTDDPISADAMSDSDNQAANEPTTAAQEDSWRDERFIDLSKVPPMPPEYEDADVRTGPPWENRDGLGLLSAFLKTLGAINLGPGTFFKTMRVQGGMFPPLMFAILVGWLGAMFVMVWGQVFPADYTQVNELFQGEFQMPSQTYMNLASFILTPVFVLIFTFVFAGIFHLFLIMFNGAKNGFEATFRVVCYSYAASVFFVIPFIGTLLGNFYSMVLLTIGLGEAQEIDGWKAFLVVILPIVLFCCCCCAPGFMLMISAVAEKIPELQRLLESGQF